MHHSPRVDNGSYLKSLQRKDIERKTEKFLKRGGKIEVSPDIKINRDPTYAGAEGAFR